MLVQQKLNEGVNDAFVVQRALKELHTIAESGNAVFLPYEAMANPAILLGIMNKVEMKNAPVVGKKHVKKDEE